MKRVFWLLLAGLVAGGCATSTIESRKKELYGAYSNLAPQVRTAVDQGQVKVGMSMEAVFIAWGKPSQSLTNESSKGTFVTWLYEGSHLKSYRYWASHNYLYSDGSYGYPYLATGYYPESYVRSEVIFEDGLVHEWRTLPRPVY